MSYPPIDIFSRARGWGMLNKYMTQLAVWPRTDSNLGTSRLHLGTNDCGYETTGYRVRTGDYWLINDQSRERIIWELQFKLIAGL